MSSEPQDDDGISEAECAGSVAAMFLARAETFVVSVAQVEPRHLPWPRNPGADGDCERTGGE
jgi:hypothetical protein